MDIQLPLERYRDLGRTTAVLYVWPTRAELSYFRRHCTVDGQPFEKGELTFGDHDVTMESHRFKLHVALIPPEEVPAGILRYRIYHPDDAPSSSDRRSALIDLASSARDQTGNVTMTGDESVIARARAVVADMPDGIISTAWLTRISPMKLREGMRHPAFARFRPELVGGDEVFARRAPPRLRGDAQALGFTETFARSLHGNLPLLDQMNEEDRGYFLRRVEDDIWGWQHWRPTQASAESAAATIARGLAELIARERQRHVALGDPSRKQPGYVPLVGDTVTEEQALALARAFVAAFEAARLDDPAALATDLRRRVQALHLV